MTRRDPLRSAELWGKAIYAFTWLFVFMGLGYLVGLLPESGPDSRLDGQIDDLIKTELSLGASASQVKAWLVAKKIENFSYNNKDLNYDSSVDQSQFKPKQLSGIISVGLDTGRSFLSYRFTHITFFFGKKGGLIGYSVERGGIGL